MGGGGLGGALLVGGEGGGDLVVGGVGEGAVPESDGVEGVGGAKGEAFEGWIAGGEFLAGAWWCDGHGDDDAAGAEGLGGFDGGTHGGAGGEAVVDEDDGAVVEIEGWPAGAVGGFATLEFGGLGAGDAVDGFLGEGEFGDDLGVEYTDAASDGAECEFGLVGEAEFADDDDVEGEGEDAGDFGGDDDAATGEAEDDGVGRGSGAPEGFGEEAAGFAPVSESLGHGGSLVQGGGRVEGRWVVLGWAGQSARTPLAASFSRRASRLGMGLPSRESMASMTSSG